MDKAENAMVTITKERYDHFIWEIERLREALKNANENHEHFQREWYLRGDEIERLRQIVLKLNSVAYVIDGHGIAHHSFTIVYKELE
jgi:hypothetical protein